MEIKRINDELNKLGIVCDSFSILQDKDGITVARIASNEKSYVIKGFQKDEHSGRWKTIGSWRP